MRNKEWKYNTPVFEYLRDLSVVEAPWGGHNFFAYDLVVNFRPATVVELGTFKGYSLFSFSQAVKDCKLKTKIHAVDTWEGDKHAGFFGDELYKEFKKVLDKHYQDLDIILHRKTFDDAVEEFQNNSIDILHIDGLHTYKAVKHDFETWLPKVKKDSGVILLHDIYVKRDDFGVHKLWAELKKKYKNTVSFKHSNGLGVIFLGTQNITDNPKDFIDYYQHLAESQYNKKYVEVLEEQIKQKKSEIQEYDKNLRICIKQRESLKEDTLLLMEKVKEFEDFKKTKIWKSLTAWRRIKSKL